MTTPPLEDKYEKDTFSLFSSRIGQEEFSKRFRSLDEKTMGRFIRAWYLYQKALKLRTTEPDISMALLYTSIESAIDSSSSLMFKDWLVKKKLEALSRKSLNDTREVLNSLYEEYLASEEEREGVTYNFKRFLVMYYPKGFRRSPMIIYSKGSAPPRDATFEEGVTYTYSKFRSLFIPSGDWQTRASTIHREVGLQLTAGQKGRRSLWNRCAQCLWVVRPSGLRKHLGWFSSLDSS